MSDHTLVLQNLVFWFKFVVYQITEILKHTKFGHAFQ
jgi:hypothetical protein